MDFAAGVRIVRITRPVADCARKKPSGAITLAALLTASTTARFWLLARSGSAGFGHCVSPVPLRFPKITFGLPY
jgi:hypothetical protein